MSLGAWAGFSGTAVAADELATALFSPSSVSAESFAKLHGQLDSTFWTGGATIPAWAIQPGAFFAGFSLGFERWSWVYAKQKQSETLYAIHAGLSRRFFLPWQTRMIIYGYNLWCRQDAAYWDQQPGSPIREYWTLTTSIDGTVKDEATIDLPHARGDEAGVGPSPDPGDDADNATSPQNSAEDRWRYVSPVAAVMPLSTTTDAALDKGYHSIEVKVSGTIASPDNANAKLATPTGALWMLAIRS